MSDWLRTLIDTSDFPARWHCGDWTALHGWTHVVSDVLIWGAYVSIPIALVTLILKRPDTPFPKIFWYFGAFIFSCGTVHLIEASIFWYPMYRVSALAKVFTALASWATVIALVPILPRAVRMPGLEGMNAALSGEVQERRVAEARLRAHAEELEHTNDMMVRRELRVIELKREVNALCERAGVALRYDLDFADADQADAELRDRSDA